MKSDNLSYERYQRQTALKEFGLPGQQKLLQSKVLVIGAGGLGCPALQYLVAAGVGTIGIADDDVVSITNLHRQVLFSTFDIGFSKAEKARLTLTRLNPEVSIIVYKQRITTHNALAIFGAYDIIIDGTDNFASRYLVNDACVLLGKPLVYGAISKFEGQVALFNCRHPNGDTPVNYRDLFPQPPLESEAQNCAEAGVLGVLPGIIGTMMANETIKLIAGVGKPLINSILTYNALNNHSYELHLVSRPETRSLLPATAADFMHTNYDWLCQGTSSLFEIDNLTFDSLRSTAIVDIIDVREPGEMPLPTGFNYMQIPLLQLKERTASIKSDHVVIFCQSGKRSLQAAQLLFNEFSKSKKIYSLQGGILNWIKNNPAQQ